MKQIKFTYKDQDYILEYTRKTVKVMEGNGFNINEIDTKPMLMVPILFRGAFLSKHRFVKDEVVDDIYKNISHKTELIETLVEMYTDTIETLFDEPESGNLEWTKG